MIPEALGDYWRYVNALMLNFRSFEFFKKVNMKKFVKKNRHPLFVYSKCVPGELLCTGIDLISCCGAWIDRRTPSPEKRIWKSASWNKMVSIRFGPSRKNFSWAPSFLFLLFLLLLRSRIPAIPHSIINNMSSGDNRVLYDIFSGLVPISFCCLFFFVLARLFSWEGRLEMYCEYPHWHTQLNCR